MYLEKETQVCKNIQNRLAKHQPPIKVSMPDIRQAYNYRVADVNNPMEIEIENIYQSFLPTTITTTTQGHIVTTEENKHQEQKNAIIPQTDRHAIIATQAQEFGLEISDTQVSLIDAEIDGYNTYPQFMVQAMRAIKNWLEVQENQSYSELEKEKQELRLFMQQRQQRLANEVQGVVNMTGAYMTENRRFLRQFQTAIEQRFTIPSKPD